MTSDNRYLHLIRQDCPLPPGTHVVVYYRDSGGDEQAQNQKVSVMYWHLVDVDLRDKVPLTRHILHFEIPLTSATESNLRNPDKEQLRVDILVMREQGMSYRQIAAALGIHWTRVGQVVKAVK